MTPELRKVEEAVEREHPCADASCGIAAALEAGYPLAAAHWLQGATECPETDAALAALGPELEASLSAELNEFYVWAKDNSKACAKCAAVTYGTAPSHCAACGKELE